MDREKLCVNKKKTFSVFTETVRNYKPNLKTLSNTKLRLAARACIWLFLNFNLFLPYMYLLNFSFYLNTNL